MHTRNMSLKFAVRSLVGAILPLTLCVAMAPAPSWAAKYWTGNTSGNWQTSGNWNGTSGRRYFMKGQLKGNKSDLIYLSANVTESSNTGLCFAEVPNRGYWRLHGTVDGTTYTFDNSGNSSNYDQDLICIGYSGTGSSARFYGITLKTRHLTIGGHATLGGHNILKSGADECGTLTGLNVLEISDRPNLSVNLNSNTFPEITGHQHRSIPPK